ncbi:MAG: hypothetical protein AB8I08_14245 [Sandaracinaceae bacterium]
MFAITVAYLVLVAAVGAWVHGESWDFRAHARDPLDGTWRLELAWLAGRGAWSGVDFHYPRGPLWQLVGGVAHALCNGDAGWTHALYDLLFQLCTLALLGAFVRRRVPRAPASWVVFTVLGVFSTAVGTATLRALLPLMAIDAAVRANEDGWRGPARVAAWMAVGMLVSFDRLVAMTLSVLAVLGAGLLVAVLQRTAKAWMASQVRLVGALVVASVVLALGFALAGGSLVRECLTQLRIAGDYAGRMAMGWSAPVSGWAVAAFVVCVGGLAAVRRRDAFDAPDSSFPYLMGALPAVAFGVIRADAEHLVLATLPLVAVLLVLSVGAFEGESRVRRAAAAVLFLVAAGSIAVSRPDALAGNPRVFWAAAAVAAGEQRPNPDWRSDDAAAVAYARSVRRPGECVAASADLTLVHPMADVRGPTELSIRWSSAWKEELADAIAERDCPHFVYSLLTYEWPGTNWILGPDFVEVARRYELDRQVGASVLGMRRRVRPRRIERARLTAERRTWSAEVPGQIRVPLGGVIQGTDIVELPLRVTLDGWRMRVGGAPVVEWRFERDGEPVAGWVPMPDVAFNRWGTVQLSPDPAATEWLWMGGREPSRHRRADTLALRLRPRGVSTPHTVEVSVRPIDRLRIPIEARPERSCDGRVDLLSMLQNGQAYGRYFAPDVRADRFSFEPNRPNDYEAEVSFPVTPCADSCLRLSASVEAPASASDGIELGVHVFEPPRRTDVYYEVIRPGGEPQEISLPLEDFAGRPVLLQLRSLPWRQWGEDAARIIRPRIQPCALEVMLTEVERLEVPRGSLTRVGRDLALSAGGARVEATVPGFSHLCLGFGTAAQSPVRIAVHAEDGAAEPYVHRITLPPGEASLDPFPLSDVQGRDVVVVLDVHLADHAEGRLVEPRLERCVGE